MACVNNDVVTHFLPLLLLLLLLYYYFFLLYTWEKGVASLPVSPCSTSGLSSAEKITYIFEDLAGEYY